jgi:hypothetical protein
MYVEYEVRTTNNNIVTSDTLYLHANSGPDVVLSSTTQNETQIPGPVIPDGNGGLLATWTASTPVIQQYPYQAVDVINGVVGTPYGLPFSPQTVTPFQSPDLVLGESGTAFASGTTNVTINGVQTPIDEIASFNVTSGAPNWTYQAAAGDKLSMIEASADGGVTVNDSVLGVIHLSASGIPNSSTVSSLPSGAVPFDLSNWVSASNGTASSFFSPDGTNGISTILAQSASPQHLGNQQGQSLPPYCRRGNVNCALAPHSDGLAGPNQYTYGIVVRQVTYWLFNLQNGTLNPLVGPGKTPPPVKIEEWEANSSDLNVDYCSWHKQGTECETPNTAAGGPDKAGQITDKMGAVSGSFTMQQQFLVDRQGVQVFWPNQNGSWYGAWGTTAPSPPNFHPNQSTNTTVGWATITQINANYAAPTSCISGCDTRPPNSGPPSQ